MDAEVRPRPCTTMTDSAPSGGGGEQPDRIHSSAQVTVARSFLITMSRSQRLPRRGVGPIVYPNAWVSASNVAWNVLVVTTIGDPMTTSMVEKGTGCILRSQDLVRKDLVATTRRGMMGTLL